jgi:hypothetical protein
VEDITSDDGKSDDKLLIEFEDALRASPSDNNLRDARAVLRTYLWRKAGKTCDGSTVEAIETLSNHAIRTPDVAASCCGH